MNCARLRQVLDAWLDGELDTATGAEIGQHVRACAACASLRDERVAVGRCVRDHAPYYRAPASLGRAVRRSLAEAVEAPAQPSRRPSWLQAGAFALVTALAGLAGGYWLGSPLPDGSLREQVVASHVASLAPSRRLTDVGSADRHVVKPWFQGKVDFAPVVRDLSAEGYTLLGARLDHVADRQAAAIVYRVRNHVVTLFAWRAATAADESLSLTTARGFNVATWTESGLQFAAVSDVDAKDIERFARLVQGPR